MNNITQETMDLTKSALSKAVTQATGIVGYDLQAPAKNLYPTITPLRNTIPRVTRLQPGTATNWKQITSILGSGYDAMGYVPEGGRSASMSYTTAPKSAGYITIGEEDSITFEAENASVGFEDVNATVTMRLLQKMMRKEEMMILGGNATLALGTPTAPTTAFATTGGTIAGASLSVIVVALTFEGYQNYISTGSSLVTGLPITKTITGNDGNTFTLNGGSSNKSAATAVTPTGSTATVSASTPVVAGAVAYGWYVGVAGSEKLEAVTLINSVKLTALAGTGQVATAITADRSLNATFACDGLLSSVANPANSALVTSLATGTAGTGSTLTSNGTGGIVEFDTLLDTMYRQFKISPRVIYVSTQELKNITAKIVANGSAPLLKYEMSGTGGSGGYSIVASGRVTAYHNPYSHDENGIDIPIRVHPDMPPGTILFDTPTLPEWYQSNEVPNVREMICRKDYYRIDWPLRTRKREYGVYAEETMAIYAPFAMAIMNNIANG